MNKFSAKIVELYPWMISKAKYYCKSKDDADDLVSETILRLLVNREKYDHKLDLKPWCVAVMRNLWSNRYQRNSIITFVSFDDAYSFQSTPNEFNEAYELLKRMSKQSLNVHCLDLYVQGYTYEEIGDMLGVKIGTVRSRIFNGRKALKSLLQM